MNWLMFLILVAALWCGSADARTWNVRKDGTGDYTVIQDAVDHAAAGDTIRIGPGRFEEKRPFTSVPVKTAEKWTFDVYVAVTISDLTLIGAGADQTTIGPHARLWVDPAEPKVICTTPLVARLVVEDLAMENVFNGIYRTEGGTLEVRRCSSRGCAAGVTTWSELGTVIEDCHFQDVDYGVISYYPAQNVTIALCDFIACEAAFEHTLNAVITDCRFTGYTVGCQFASNSSGAVYSSTFEDQVNVGVVVTTGSTVQMAGNRISGSAVNLRVRSGSSVAGWDNEFSGGSYATLRISNSAIQLHGCQILHGAGPSVLLETYLNPPVRVLDLTNNYWGTDSTSTIAGWIFDYYDDVRVCAKVQYAPFLGQPVPTEPTSWGNLKALWR